MSMEVEGEEKVSKIARVGHSNLVVLLQIKSGYNTSSIKTNNSSTLRPSANASSPMLNYLEC